MKTIEAFVNPASVRGVKSALDRIGIEGITVTNVPARRRTSPWHQHFSDETAGAGLPSGARIRFDVPDARAEEAVTAIVTTGRVVELDGNDVFVSTIEDSIRVGPANGHN